MDISLSEFLYQLAIVVIVFTVSINLTFKKLLNVLQERESKTTLLEIDAEKRMQKANELQESYRAKIDIAYRENQKIIKIKKEEIFNKENEKFKSAETELNKEVDSERKRIIETFKEKEVQVLKEADTLAGDLVNRIVQ